MDHILANLNIGQPANVGYVAPATASLDIPSAPTLLSLPREIRDIIYGNLLTLDRTFEHRLDPTNWARKFPGLALMAVNRQLRAEALDTIVSSNVWIHVTILSDIRDELPVMMKQVHNHDDPLLSQAVRQRMMTAATVHMRFGEQCRRESKYGYLRGGNLRQDSFMFALHPTTFGFFVNDIAATVLMSDKYKCGDITIDLNILTRVTTPKPIQYMLDQILHPLARVVRGAKRVSVWGVCARELMASPFANGLANTMKQDTASFYSMTKILLLFGREGRQALEAGDYGEAMRLFWTGTDAYSRFMCPLSNPLGLNSPQSNSLIHVALSLHRDFSEAAFRHFEQCRKEFDGKVVGHVQDYLVDKAIACAHRALEFEGITDMQRRLGHLRRGLAFQNKGDYMAEYHSMPKSRRPKLTSKMWTEPHRPHECYTEAARDFYYAIQVHPANQSVSRLTTLYERMCKKIGRPVDLGFEVKEIQLPLIGLWRGDPRLLEMWGREKYLLMKLARQRINENFGEEMLDHQWLKAQYASQGIWIA